MSSSAPSQSFSRPSQRSTGTHQSLYGAGDVPSGIGGAVHNCKRLCIATECMAGKQTVRPQRHRSESTQAGKALSRLCGGRARGCAPQPLPWTLTVRCKENGQEGLRVKQDVDSPFPPLSALRCPRWTLHRPAVPLPCLCYPWQLPLKTPTHTKAVTAGVGVNKGSALRALAERGGKRRAAHEPTQIRTRRSVGTKQIDLGT